MKQLILSLSLLATVANVSAQDLPRPSPNAKVDQVVGLTEISVTYSRPGVKDRVIWGDLVPYGELWRAGANKATMIEVSHAIKVNGQDLPAGSYSFFILPGKDGRWTAIFNQETELWGTSNYDKEKDQLRLEVKVQDLTTASERLEYHFLDVDMESAVLAMDWENKRLALNIESNPIEQAQENIASALEDATDENRWKVYRNAASFARDYEMTAEGLKWIQESVKLKETWYGYWLYGQLLAQNKNYKEATAKGKKAIELGESQAKEDGDVFGYTSRIQADIDSWKKNMK